MEKNQVAATTLQYCTMYIYKNYALQPYVLLPLSCYNGQPRWSNANFLIVPSMLNRESKSENFWERTLDVNHS